MTRDEDDGHAGVDRMQALKRGQSRGVGQQNVKHRHVRAVVGEEPVFDPTAFASLTAADFSANDQLARMIGEPEFGALFHQGERESMYLADVVRRVILVVLFDNRTTLGLVKLRVRGTVGTLGEVFTAMFAPGAQPPPRMADGFVGEAEDELDRLFGE